MQTLKALLFALFSLSLIAGRFYGLQQAPSFAQTPIKIAAIGDYGYGQPETLEIASMIDNWQVDYIITTGDNNYSSNLQVIDDNIGKAFSHYIYPYKGRYESTATKNRFYPSLGNHDWYQNNFQAYIDYFTLPNNERYYDVKINEFLHLFAIDSDPHEPDGIHQNSKQALWLKQKLQDSSAKWKIVYLHHPPYSSSQHGSNKTLQWPYKEWGAATVLGGHDHVYERIHHNGFVYFVNGLGGARIYNFRSTVDGSIARYNQQHGALLIQVWPHAISYEFYNRKGTLIDQYIEY